MPVNDTPSADALAELRERAAASIQIEMPEPDPERLRKVRRLGVVHEGMDDHEGMDWKDRPKGTGKRLKEAEKRIDAAIRRNLRDAMADALVERQIYHSGKMPPQKPRSGPGGMPTLKGTDGRPPVETTEDTRQLETRRKLFALVRTADVHQEDLVRLLSQLGIEEPSYDELTESDENLFL